MGTGHKRGRSGAFRLRTAAAPSDCPVDAGLAHDATRFSPSHTICSRETHHALQPLVPHRDAPVPAPAAAPSALPSAPPASAAASHALYTLVNLLTGPPTHKDALVHRSGLLARVCEHLCPTAPEDLALPAVWCIINLTWPTERDERLAARCRALQQARVDERLDELVRAHGSRDVQERARTAREQVRRGAGGGPGGQEGGVGGGSVVVLTPAAPTGGVGTRDVN